MPLPTIGEQADIVATIDAVAEKEQVHRRKHTGLNDLFRTLLHQLMTAQIRVNDLDLRELESAMAA